MRRISALSAHKRALFDARMRGRFGWMKEREDGAAPSMPVPEQQTKDVRPITFSCFFFSGDGAIQHSGKYDMLIDCARFADHNDFEAVWTPERHFKAFGGLYPNPAVLSAALGMVTRRIAIRAGSVVLPLHDPLRAAEEWSIVDNLSGGRVGIAVASGWHPDDFALLPERYAQRRELAFEHIKTLRRLWSGATVDRSNGAGTPVSVRIFPHPIQRELPLWITAMSERSFVEAGRMGANVLTGLMDQDVNECARRIVLYRRARAEQGFEPESGRVTLMVHTYIGADLPAVRALVRAPMLEYLRSFLKASEAQLQARTDVGALLTANRADDRQALLEHAFERYFETRSLLGTHDSCARTVRRLSASGVDELACLLDFGLDHKTVLEGLERLNALRRAAQTSSQEASHPGS